MTSKPEKALLHIIPASALSNTYHGTYKDVISRVRRFETADFPYTQVLLKRDDPASIKVDLPDHIPSHILIEYTYFPRILRFLRAHYPKACIVSRAINTEPLQHISNLGWWPKKGPIWMLYGILRLIVQDIHCKFYSDVILSINDWENRSYWNKLPGKTAVEWLPYYCPDHLISDVPLPLETRNIIACLPTSQRNRKSVDLVKRFCRFAEIMRKEGSTYRFIVTGNLTHWPPPTSNAVEYVGFVSNLPDFMEQCRAIALLSPLGYGFKTTIADALAAGSHVIVNPKLLKRCPSTLIPYLIACNDNSPILNQTISKRLEAKLQGRSLHLALKKENNRVMREWIS